MLARETETRNFSAISVVDVKEDNTGVPAMYMNASLSADGNLSFSNAIKDTSLYFANKEWVDRDWMEFQESVVKKIEK